MHRNKAQEGGSSICSLHGTVCPSIQFWSPSFRCLQVGLGHKPDNQRTNRLRFQIVNHPLKKCILSGLCWSSLMGGAWKIKLLPNLLQHAHDEVAQEQALPFESHVLFSALLPDALRC